MKKTIWSLAALMLMAAAMMTSCSNNLDEVEPAEEVQSRVVTITIAPPAAEPVTRVTMAGMKITGWEVGDVVNLYAITNNDDYYNFASGTSPITLRCTNASEGTFRGTLPEGVDGIDSYNLAVYGATAVAKDGYIGFLPKTMCSTDLKDVVIMAAYKSGSSYTMQIANNVLKIKNSTSSDIEAAWRSKNYPKSLGSTQVENFRVPLSGCSFDESDVFTLGAPPVLVIDNTEYKGWDNAKHFTLKKGVDSYVNAGMFNHGEDQWGIAKEDGTTCIIKLENVGGKAGVKGKIWNADTYDGSAIGQKTDD